VLVVFWFSQWLDLQTVNWISTPSCYLIFGIIVVFRPRSEDAGHLGTPLLGAFRAQRTEAMVDGGVEAATCPPTRPGHHRHQREGASGYIEMTSPWTYHHDLLISIFSGTPLRAGGGHQGNQWLPVLSLTVNPELSRQLGGRHRAAIGVTETQTPGGGGLGETGAISWWPRKIRRDHDGHAEGGSARSLGAGEGRRPRWRPGHRQPRRTAVRP
jgi:hypothetical protein